MTPAPAGAADAHRPPRAPSRRARAAVAGRGADDARDRGATSIELVMYTPMLMVVIFLTVQFALSWHGSQVAGVVAREAARDARTNGGTLFALVQAEQDAYDFARELGGAALTDVRVEVAAVPGAQEVSVTVSGRSVEIIPGFAPRVSRTVQGPVESFRPDL